MLWIMPPLPVARAAEAMLRKARGRTCFPALAYNSARSMMLLANSKMRIWAASAGEKNRGSDHILGQVPSILGPGDRFRQQHRSMASPQGRRMKDFGPLHRNPRSI